MIYITGDTHIPVDIQKLSTKNFPQQKELTKDDLVIICGDFGGVWDGSAEERYWIKWLKEKNFTTMFVDGNHENFDRLKEYPVAEFAGGKVHKIDDGIYHLMRGEVFTIDGKKIFVFGGASSHDKEHRKEGVSWWADEMPSEEEYLNAEENLERNGNSVDFIITHCAPTSVQRVVNINYEENKLTDFLDKVKMTTSYKQWFFGHYHKNKNVDEKHKAVFDEVILCDDTQVSV